MIKNNKKGSVPVFLASILLSFVLILSVLAESAAGIVGREYANGVMDLAGRSILSEYDRHLKEDYGLFGLLINTENAEKKLDRYVGENIASKAGYTDLFSLKPETVRVDLSSYALTDTDRLEKQIMEFMELRIFSESWNALELLNTPEQLDQYSDSEKEKRGGTTRADRNLKNQRIIDALPSNNLKEAGEFSPGLPNNFELKKLAGETKEALSLNLYILKCFRHDLDDGAWENTFFKNEVEYILAGSLSDSKNKNLVRLGLIGFRTGLDLAHIGLDPKKRKEIMAVAALISPGPGAAIAAAVVAAAWAVAEASNDASRLYAGGRVPLYKTSADWVIDLDSLIEKTGKSVSLKKNAPQPQRNSSLKPEADGLKYENYLFLLLCFKSRETKLLRIMDIIQINMKGNYYSDFLLSDCYGGIDFTCTLERTNSFLPAASLRRGVFFQSHVY